MGQLRSYCHFDHEFFEQTEIDSNDMGPQARMLYEVVYEALYDAGKKIIEFQFFLSDKFN